MRDRRAWRAAAVVALVLAAGLLAESARAGAPTAIKTSNRDEWAPSGNASYFAWNENTRRRPRRYAVWFEPAGGGPRVKVSSGGSAFAGRMDPLGSTLPYHQVVGRSHDVRLFDMAIQDHLDLPPGINTGRQSEFWASRYGNTMTFIRCCRQGDQLFLVTDLTTGAKIVIENLNPNRIVYANTPNIQGDYVTWAACTRNECEAYRYQISTQETLQIPNPRTMLYFTPAVDLSGNVYFARSRFGCGRNVRLMKWTGAGDPTVFHALPRGVDTGSSSIYDDGGGNVTFFFDYFDCGTGNGDIYSFTNP